MEQHFKDLHAAALKMSTALIGSASDHITEQLGAAVKGGASIVMELGPLPDVRTVTLYLVEREGQRHRIVTQSVQAHPLQ